MVKCRNYVIVVVSFVMIILCFMVPSLAIAAHSFEIGTTNPPLSETSEETIKITFTENGPGTGNYEIHDPEGQLLTFSVNSHERQVISVKIPAGKSWGLSYFGAPPPEPEQIIEGETQKEYESGSERRVESVASRTGNFGEKVVTYILAAIVGLIAVVMVFPKSVGFIRRFV